MATKKMGGAPAGSANVRTGLGADALAEALVDNLHYLQAKLPRHATRNDWYMALAYTVRDRMLDRYIRTVEAISGAEPRRQGRRVSLGRIPDRTASGQQPHQPGDLGGCRGGVVESRPGPVRHPGAGRGARPGQWRSRTPGRLLHGLAGHAQRPRHRLRHPLRVRHLRSGHSRRLAGRADGQVAALRQPVGDRALGDHLRRAVRRAHRVRSRRPGARSGALASREGGQGRRLRHAGAGLPGAHHEPAAAVEGGSHRVVRLRRVQRRRLLRRGGPEGGIGNDLQGAVSERRARGGQAAAARAAVLLRLLLAPGHDPPAPDARQAIWPISTDIGPRS